MSKPTYSLIADVNLKVNSSTKYRRDIDLYGKPEFWQVANGQGDCEDYALAKRKILTDLGYGGACRLATCWTETKEYHAVLIVTTNKGDYVLDNRYKFPMMRQELNYKWHQIQEGKQWFYVTS